MGLGVCVKLKVDSLQSYNTDSLIQMNRDGLARNWNYLKT